MPCGSGFIDNIAFGKDNLRCLYVIMKKHIDMELI